MLRTLAHQALNLKQPADCVELAEESLRRSEGRVDNDTRALLLITSARAYGASGERGKAARALLAAENMLLNGGGLQPRYALATGPAAATVASHTAKTLSELGDYAAAERHHRAALSRRDPEAFRRIHALTFSDLAKSLAAQGRADEAVAAWGQSLDFMAGVVSARNRRTASTVRTTMSGYRKRGVPGAGDLENRAVELLRA